MEAFSAGGEIWGRRSKELEALAFIPIWDDRLDPRTDTQKKGKTLKVVFNTTLYQKQRRLSSKSRDDGAPE